MITNIVCSGLQEARGLQCSPQRSLVLSLQGCHGQPRVILPLAHQCSRSLVPHSQSVVTNILRNVLTDSGACMPKRYDQASRVCTQCFTPLHNRGDDQSHHALRAQLVCVSCFCVLSHTHNCHVHTHDTTSTHKRWYRHLVRV